MTPEKKQPDFSRCDAFVERFEEVIEHPVKGTGPYYVGVDLGTACVVMAVLDRDHQPVAGIYEYADVVKDGMVVDYIGAIRMVRAMKEKMEEALGEELLYAAAAIPPGTDELDGGAVKHVVEGAGFEVTNLSDESTAANQLLGLANGAVVDIGGGTTGISIFKDGEVVLTDDEATGGTHVSLVVAGSYHMPFSEAELYKRDPKNHKELFPVVRPVMEKMATIISDVLDNYKTTTGNTVDQLVLCGGTSCFTGMEQELERLTGVPTYKPKNPLFVTPLGIALSCTGEED